MQLLHTQSDTSRESSNTHAMFVMGALRTAESKMPRSRVQSLCHNTTVMSIPPATDRSGTVAMPLALPFPLPTLRELPTAAAFWSLW